MPSSETPEGPSHLLLHGPYAPCRNMQAGGPSCQLTLAFRCRLRLGALLCTYLQPRVLQGQLALQPPLLRSARGLARALLRQRQQRRQRTQLAHLCTRQ